VTSDVAAAVGIPVDPALPGLAAALSAHPPGTAPEDDCRVRHVEWVPRRRCQVVHEVRTLRRGATFLAYEVTASGTAARSMAEDPALPGLPSAMDPAVVRDRLAELLRMPVRTCRITPVAYRPATRAVLAYDVPTPSGRERLFAKLLAGGVDRYAAAADALLASARGRHSPAPVPEVVAVWPDLAAVVQRAAPGRTLSAVLRDEALPDADRMRAAELLGRLLAGVHSTPLADPPPWSAEDELAALESLLPPTCHADPAMGRSFAALVDRLADDLPVASDPVFSHGAFRTGQVLLQDGVLSLLDLDTVSASDAARDAGNALGYLTWADVRGAVRPGLFPALSEAVLAGYAGSRAALPAQALAWWTAAAMAKIAGRRYRNLATAEWHQLPGLLSRAVMHLDSAAAVPGRARAFAGPVPAAPVDPLDSDRVTQVLRALPFLPGTGHVRVVAARLLAEAAGRRRVVRYEVSGLDPQGVVPLIGKTYLDRHRSAIAHGNLRLLSEEVFAGTPGLAVPTPVCQVPALRMVLYREVRGTPLDRMPSAVADTGGVLTARWLTSLHMSRVVLARRLDLAHEVVNVGLWAATVGDAAPDARAAAYALADRLTAAAADLPEVDEVPVHKDLHTGHVFAVGRWRAADGTDGEPPGVAVIDLDEARMGDPALDLAHVTAYLDASPWPGARAARAAFLMAYGPLPGPAPQLRSAFFGAYTSLKIAKQLVTGGGPLRAPAVPPRMPALMAVLRRGAACLAG
jgi:aminoglycoside phosphotransferase (APT) family kinase protein